MYIIDDDLSCDSLTNTVILILVAFYVTDTLIPITEWGINKTIWKSMFYNK